MGGGSHLLNVYNSSHAYQMKRLTAYIPMSIMRYSNSSEGKKFHEFDGGDGEDEEEQPHVREERAPSTAQEFMKVAAKKNIREGSTNSGQKQKARDNDDDSDQQTTTSSSSDSDEEEK